MARHPLAGVIGQKQRQIRELRELARRSAADRAWLRQLENYQDGLVMAATLCLVGPDLEDCLQALKEAEGLT